MCLSVQAIIFEAFDIETFNFYMVVDLDCNNVSRSLGQGHILENGNFATWISV